MESKGTPSRPDLLYVILFLPGGGFGKLRNGVGGLAGSILFVRKKAMKSARNRVFYMSDIITYMQVQSLPPSARVAARHTSRRPRCGGGNRGGLPRAMVHFRCCLLFLR